MDRMHSLYLKYTARTVGLDSCLCEVDGTNEPYIHTYQMHFIKLENPKSPFLRQFSINMDRNISPVFMVEFQSVQPKSNASTDCFNKSFFKTPVPIDKWSNLHTEFEVITMHIIINIGTLFFPEYTDMILP